MIAEPFQHNRVAGFGHAESGRFGSDASFLAWMWSLSTSSMDARADECRAQRRRRTNGDDSPPRTARTVVAEGLLWTATERMALQHGEELREALEARNAVAVCGWMDGTCLRRVRVEVDRRHQGAIFEAVDVNQGGSVPPGPPPLPPVDTAGAERCSVEEKGAADTAAEHLQRMNDGISLSGVSSLPRSPRDSAPDARRLRSSLAGQQLRTSRKEAHSHLARRPPGAPTASTDKLHTALRAISPSPRRGRRHAITAECTSFVPAVRNGRNRPCLVCGQERHCLVWCAALPCGSMNTHRVAALRATREAGWTLGTQLDCLDERMKHEAREEVERVARSRLAERPVGSAFDRTANSNTEGYTVMSLHGAASLASSLTTPRRMPRMALASPRPAFVLPATSLPRGHSSRADVASHAANRNTGVDINEG